MMCRQRRWAASGRVRRSFAALCCIVAAGAIQPLQADDWTQFRGSNAAGVSADTTPLPTEFSFEDGVRWQAALGDGVACPVVAGGRVFSTAMTGPERFAVIALDASSGAEIWRRELETGPLPAITPPNSHASSTPATDGRRVFVYFSTIGLLAFDVADGREVWRHPLPAPAYLLDWGAAGSPIVYQDLVIFNQDDDLDSYLLALDAATGELRWRTPRPEMLAGYAVPVICQAGGRTDLVVAGSGKLKGYDPATGQERWTCNTLLRTIMSSPVVHDGVIYVSVQSYGDTDRLLKSALLEWKDTNQDGRLTKEEVPREFWTKFDAGNTNADEFLEGEEIDRAFQSPDNMVGGGRIIQAIRGGGEGDVTATHLLWNLNNRAPSNISSPLVVGGRLHVVKRGGLSSCFDAATGDTLWETKRIDNLGDYFASPVAGDGKIYMAGENGFVVVLADSPELEVLARNDMGESCVATPAIADGALFIRTREKLFCVGP
jgi:outer membrane protein assembly factor BamB